MAKLFRISVLSHERLLLLTSMSTDNGDQLCTVLRSGIVVNVNIEILCDGADADLLLLAMRVVCPEEAAVNPVE
jgi:hypothetical protein